MRILSLILRAGLAYMCSFILVLGQQTSNGGNSDDATIVALRLDLAAALRSLAQSVQLANQVSDQVGDSGPQMPWLNINVSALSNVQELAFELGAESYLELQPVIGSISLPSSTPGVLGELIKAQGSLADQRAQIHNQLVSSFTGDVSSDQLSQIEQAEFQSLEQQASSSLQALVSRAQILADQSSHMLGSLPPALIIPSNTSPSLAAYLVAEDALIRDQINLSNQYVNASSTVRNAALWAWLQQNRTRFEQLRTLAQNISSSTSGQILSNQK